MTDPYGRNKVPAEPKGPSLFNPFTPLKFLVYAWFLTMDLVFRSSWSEMMREADGAEVPYLFMILLGNVLLNTPTVLVTHFVFGMGPLSIGGVIAGIYLIHTVLYFMFQLHNKESRELWFEKVRP